MSVNATVSGVVAHALHGVWGLGVSPGVVGRRGNRGAYVPRVRCVVPIGRLISPYYSISVPCARRPVKGTYERIPWYPLYVPRGGDHPRMYPARTTTDGAYHHSMKRQQHETGTRVHKSQSVQQSHTTSRSLRASCDARSVLMTHPPAPALVHGECGRDRLRWRCACLAWCL